MAHTAVAATMFPLLLAIYSLYDEGDKPTRFGKGLFMGMAYVAGAGSIVTLLGAARGAVALGFFKDVTDQEVSFFELTYYMAPIGWIMTFLLFVFFMVVMKPEKKSLPGLKEKAKRMYGELGPMTRNEILASLIVATTICVISAQSFFPALSVINKGPRLGWLSTGLSCSRNRTGSFS
jgi:sodium-dependent dicarboxylate transporter 2/3/5